MQLLNILYNKLVKYFVNILLFILFKLATNNLISISKSINIKKLFLNISIYWFEALNLLSNRTSNLKNLYKEDANKNKTINNCIY